MNKDLRALYGLKYSPFSPDVPVEALVCSTAVDDFCWRVEQGLAQEGGFAMITGDVGQGKSVSLRLIESRLERMRDVTVGALMHPQSNLADFYREMGDLFGVPLRPHNRWAGFKALRERWVAHIEGTLMRPVLLVDEAQDMAPPVLNELRVLASTRFDSRSILGVVLAGDQRLTAKLQHDDLVPLGSRIRSRLRVDAASVDELRACLTHRMQAAGNTKLMTEELVGTLCEHALGNYRLLLNLAGELLAVAAQRELAQLDEKLYLEVFAVGEKAASGHRRDRSARRQR